SPRPPGAGDNAGLVPEHRAARGAVPAGAVHRGGVAIGRPAGAEAVGGGVVAGEAGGNLLGRLGGGTPLAGGGGGFPAVPGRHGHRQSPPPPPRSYIRSPGTSRRIGISRAKTQNIPKPKLGTTESGKQPERPRRAPLVGCYNNRAAAADASYRVLFRIYLR